MESSGIILADLDPALESIFGKYGAVAQGILESLPWVETTVGAAPRRTWEAAAYSDHMFWAALWRPNKLFWQKAGFSVSKPAEHWIVTFRCTDPSRLTAAIAASRGTVPEGEVPVPEGLEYFPYQKAGIEFLSRTLAALLVDEPGTGKTIQTIGLLNRCSEIVRALIICPASVKYVWDRELRKWLIDKNKSISVVGRTLDATADIFVINYDLLRKYSALLVEISFDLVVLDEAHYIKSSGAIRSKAAKALAMRAPRRILLTGTPLMNRPAELWNLLNLLDAKTWGPFFPFARKYCDAKRVEFGGVSRWDFSGSSNLEELSIRLRSSGTFLRRTKADVLPQLPSVTRQVIPLDVDTSPLLEELTEALAAKVGFDPSNPPFDIDPTAIPFELVSAIRHETGLLKCEAAIKFIKETSEDSAEKVIVFAHHKDVLVALSAALPGSVKVTGESSMKNRQLAIDDFQSNPEIKYFIASTTAMGVGITLTASSRVVFVESDWTPAMMEQAESRSHRLGQSQGVLVQYLTVHDTIDEKIMRTLVSKMEVIEKVLETGPPKTIDVEVEIESPKESDGVSVKTSLLEAIVPEVTSPEEIVLEAIVPGKPVEEIKIKPVISEDPRANWRTFPITRIRILAGRTVNSLTVHEVRGLACWLEKIFRNWGAIDADLKAHYLAIVQRIEYDQVLQRALLDEELQSGLTVTNQIAEK